MAKFKNKENGSILITRNEIAIEGYKNDARYEEILDKPEEPKIEKPKKTEKSKK